MESAEYVRRVLDSWREKGIPADVDDVETGYLSLRYLKKPPVDYIELYQSLVAAMTLNKDSAAIVRSTINFAHDLGGKTVVKGVEA